MERIRLRTAATVVAALTVLVGGGCTADESSDTRGDGVDDGAVPAATGSPTASAAPDPVVLTGGGGSGGSCLTPRAARDLAFFDIGWKTSVALDSLRFRLVDPVGIHQRTGDTLDVPPVNFGGRIDYSGFSSWSTRAEALDTRSTSWAQHDAMWAVSPIAGESGLTVLHLQLDERALRSKKGASFSGVRATYRTRAGETGSVVVPPVDSMFEVMKSSIEIRKASIAPEKTPGKIRGSVTRRKVVQRSA